MGIFKFPTQKHEERKNSKGSGSDTGKLVKGTKDKDIVSSENMYIAAKK